MFKRFTFKGITMEQGDVVEIRSDSFPFKLRAGVFNFDERTNTLVVVSPQIPHRGHSGRFPEDDIKSISVVLTHGIGLSAEAHTSIQRGQQRLVRGKREGKDVMATVIAAIDGIVYGEVVHTPGVKSGLPVEGHSKFWHVV